MTSLAAQIKALRTTREHELQAAIFICKALKAEEPDLVDEKTWPKDDAPNFIAFTTEAYSRSKLKVKADAPSRHENGSHPRGPPAYRICCAFTIPANGTVQLFISAPAHGSPRL